MEVRGGVGRACTMMMETKENERSMRGHTDGRTEELLRPHTASVA